MKNKLQVLDLKSEAKKFSNQLKTNLGYQNYLNDFETNRPFLAGCTGPMSFEEWQSAQKLMVLFSKPVEVSKLSPKKKK